MEGLLFVVSAPAGTGKTTLVNMLQHDHPNIERAVTYTTRAPRKEEIEGKDYFFVSEEDFLHKKEKGEFIEDSIVFNNYYGISIKKIKEKLLEGKIIFLVIDTQGAEKIRKKINTISIFLLPPSLTELEKRLENRSSDTKEEKKLRLSWAKDEITKAIMYDYIIINDDLNNAFEALKSIVIAEQHRVRDSFKKELYEKFIQ